MPFTFGPLICSVDLHPTIILFGAIASVSPVTVRKDGYRILSDNWDNYY